MKMNALVDDRMIDLLYEASQAGVDIDLIIGGICCLRAGVPGALDNIRVHLHRGPLSGALSDLLLRPRRGLDRPAHYIGSADPDASQPRSPGRGDGSRRGPRLRDRLDEVIDVELRDDTLAWTLEGATWQPPSPGGSVETHRALQGLRSSEWGATALTYRGRREPFVSMPNDDGGLRGRGTKTRSGPREPFPGAGPRGTESSSSTVPSTTTGRGRRQAGPGRERRARRGRGRGGDWSARRAQGGARRGLLRGSPGSPEAGPVLRVVRARGEFVPSREVDEVRWVSPEAARELLSYAWDIDLLDRLLRRHQNGSIGALPSTWRRTPPTRSTGSRPGSWTALVATSGHSRGCG